MQKQIEKIFFVSEIIASELPVLNSQLRREYLWSAVNMIRNSLSNLHITKIDFSITIAFTVINKYGKCVAVQISTVLGHHKQIQKMFFVCEIIAPELAVLFSLY